MIRFLRTCALALALARPAAGASRQAAAPALPASALPAAPAAAVSSDFGKMFDLARRVLTRPEARKFLHDVFKDELTLTPEQQAQYQLPERIKEMSESQFLLLLQHNPDSWHLLEEYLAEIHVDADGAAQEKKKAAWHEKFRALIKDQRIREVFRKFNDPLTPMRLENADGSAGYADAAVFANHQTIRDGRTLPPADLKQVLLDFINGAESELMFNVFDFDLMDVADAMIARAKAGVKITGGIDKNTMAARPAVQAVFDKLNATPGITMRAVDPVGLNHQKLVARDFNDPKKAKALFSSGNFTQSCIGPEGDLKDVPAAQRPADSVPNANHMLVLDSYLLAQVAANSLTKTLVYGLRGNEYPLGGAYRVLGRKADDLPEAPSVIVSFSPKGGLGDINRDMTRRIILNTRGPLRLLQFAFSSKAVRDAIIERAKLEVKEKGSFDLKTVGDAPFAVRPWSVFLELAGYALANGEKEYVESAVNELRDAVGEKAYVRLRQDIRVAARAYRVHHMGDVEYGAKLHHKVLISGLWAVLGTSFNFSENANTNQEQFLATNDPALVAAITAVFDGLFAISPTPLVEELARRNGFLKTGGEDDLKVGDQYEHVDKEAARSRALLD